MVHPKQANLGRTLCNGSILPSEIRPSHCVLGGARKCTDVCMCASTISHKTTRVEGASKNQPQVRPKIFALKYENEASWRLRGTWEMV